jgi:EpsI family protein
MYRTMRFIPVYLLLAITGLYVNLHADVTVPMNKSFDQFPLVVQGWRMVYQREFSEQVLDVLKPTDYLYRAYRTDDGRVAQLYIGYHGGGKDGGEIHSPKHCLPGSGWTAASSKRTELVIDGKKISLVRAVYQKGESKELFFYWFQVRDRTLADEYALKLAEIGNSLLHRRRDASFIRISVPVGGDLEQSIGAGEQFVRDFYPVIAQFLPT